MLTTGLIPVLQKSSDPRVVSLIRTFLLPRSVKFHALILAVCHDVNPIFHSPIISFFYYSVLPFSQVTVSSGGMLVLKLDPHDLQFQNYRNFDGTYAYAQNKRQQVVMTRQWSTQWPDIHFSSMHPGGLASSPRPCLPREGTEFAVRKAPESL